MLNDVAIKNNSRVQQEELAVKAFLNWDKARAAVKDGETYEPCRYDGKPFGFKVTRHDSRETWLEHHNRTGKRCLLTATSASVVTGNSRFQSRVGLWREKMGLERTKDLSDNPYIQRGIEQEPLIRNGFMSQFGDRFELAYYGYDMIHCPDAPFIAATLDGMLHYKGQEPMGICGGRIEPGTYGVMEIKTGSYTTRKDYEAWKVGDLRADYLAQVTQQLLVTGFDWAIVLAKCFKVEVPWNEDLPEIIQRVYFVDAHDERTRANMQYVKACQSTFFTANILGNRCPEVALEL